ncbi:hypothetical protein FB451DRAFT_1191140 [Mycena latifolia]|nr:hypothetical protein FB451DRAFT_1191140 [Mycena latifolia]
MSSHRAFKSTKTYRPRTEQPEMPAPAPVNAVPALRTDGRALCHNPMPMNPPSLLLPHGFSSFPSGTVEAVGASTWRRVFLPDRDGFIADETLSTGPVHNVEPSSHAILSPWSATIEPPRRSSERSCMASHKENNNGPIQASSDLISTLLMLVSYIDAWGEQYGPIQDGFVGPYIDAAYAGSLCWYLISTHCRRPYSVLKDVTARLYTAHHAPVLVPVQARCASTNPQDARCPFVENIMGFTSQPYIHDVSVLVLHRGADGRSALSRFRVYYKRHRRLPKNWRLGLKAKCHSSVVNLRGSDVKLADFVIAKLAGKVRDFQETRKAVRPECFIMPNMKKVRERRT